MGNEAALKSLLCICEWRMLEHNIIILREISFWLCNNMVYDSQNFFTWRRRKRGAVGPKGKRLLQKQEIILVDTVVFVCTRSNSVLALCLSCVEEPEVINIPLSYYIAIVTSQIVDTTLKKPGLDIQLFRCRIWRLLYLIFTTESFCFTSIILSSSTLLQSEEEIRSGFQNQLRP
jgi:hypothetical protein